MNFTDLFEKMGRSNRDKCDSRPDIQDVEFQNVSESAKPSEADKENRLNQILKEAAKTFSLQCSGDPLMAAIHAAIWTEGAEWADQHSQSEFGSLYEWQKAGRDFFLESSSCANAFSYTKDLRLELLLTLSFLLGARGASENPMQCKS